MKIFLIKHNEFTWDCYLGHIIVANNEKQVRKLASANMGSEGKSVWKYAEITVQGDYTGSQTKPFILLSDYNKG